MFSFPINFYLSLSQQIKFVDEYFIQIYSSSRIPWNSIVMVFAYKCFLYYMYTITQSNKKWLNNLKQLIYFDFNTLFLKNIVYVIYSTQTSFYYIGSTGRSSWVRFQDHIRNTKNNKYTKAKKLKLYKFISRFGIHKWAIATFHNSTCDFRRLEKSYIKFLYPKLNVTYIPKRSHIYNNTVNSVPFAKFKQFLQKDYDHSTLFVHFIFNKQHFCDLLQLFRNAAFQPVTFIRTSGEFICTNWLRLERIFILKGNVTNQHFNIIFTNTTALQKILTKVKHTNCIVNITHIDKILQHTPKKIIHKLINAKSKLNVHIDVLLDKEIWQCYKYISSFTTFSRYNQIAFYRFRYVLKRKFNFFFPASITIKVPFTPSFSKKVIKQIFMDHIKSVNDNKLFISLIRNKIKIVFRKRKTVGQLLHNHIDFAKNLPETAITCSCTSCEFKLIMIRSKTHTPINNNFIVKTDTIHERFDIINAINKLLPKIKIFQRISVKQIPKLHDKKPTFLDSYHKHIYQQIKNIEKIHENRVLSPLDKNTGALISLCPSSFQKSILKLFNWKTDNSHYKLSNKTKAEIISIWKQLYYDNTAAMKLGKFNFYGSIPYAYAIPKDKDKSRFRPIASYAKHPLKWIYNRAARGLFFILTFAGIGNSLIKCQDLKNKIKCFTLNNKYKLFLTTFDIKDMYTNLKHEDIIKYVLWLLDFVNKKSRRKLICINKFGQTGVMWGRSFNAHKSVFITLHEIIDIVKMDIQNCYMFIGPFILQQIFGIPMGSPLSAVLAILCCSISEYQWNISLKISANFNHVFLCRYIDDGLIIIKSLDDNKNERELIIKNLISKYPETLRVLIEQEGKNVHFLENKIAVINDKTIILSHYNKNTQAILKTQLKVQNLIDFMSFTPYEQKLGLIIGTFTRIRRLSNDAVKSVKDIFNIIIEFLYLNYNKKIIGKALMHLIRKQKDPIWALIYLALLTFE